MITLRKAEDRGHASHGWLDTWHTFSFADYFDPEHHQYRSLRVINDDRIAAGEGFPPHSHADMEIITYVLKGALRHKDSTGTEGVIQPGDVQHMTAGRGVVHSEFNASDKEETHLLQIWIFPERRGLEPGYQQKRFDDRDDRLRLVASHDGRDGSLTIHQDADIYASVLGAGRSVKHELAAGRGAWLQVARGAVTLNGKKLKAGDGAAVEGESLEIRAAEASEFLLFDLR